MSTLLLELVGNMTFNGTIWPPHLYVYDDLLIFRKRNWFVLKEVTISYNQIARVTLNKSIFFSHMDIETTGTDDIKLRFLPKSKSSYAKSIIDQKIYRSHAKHAAAPDKNGDKVTSYERAINRLKELEVKGQISSRDLDKRKKELIKSLR